MGDGDANGTRKDASGEFYDPLDPELARMRLRARALCEALNQARAEDEAARREVLAQLFAKGGETAWVQPPFHCDYGSNRSDEWHARG